MNLTRNHSTQSISIRTFHDLESIPEVIFRFVTDKMSNTGWKVQKHDIITCWSGLSQAALGFSKTQSVCRRYASGEQSTEAMKQTVVPILTQK